MNWHLCVESNIHQGQVIPLNQSIFRIGRHPQCQLRPHSAAVSRRHCVLRLDAGRLYVIDGQTPNGTFVNEERVAGERELFPGDRLRVGALVLVVGTTILSSADSTVPNTSDEERIGDMLLALDDQTRAGTNRQESSGESLHDTTPDVPLSSSPRPESGLRSKPATDSASAAGALLGRYRRVRANSVQYPQLSD